MSSNENGTSKGTANDSTRKKATAASTEAKKGGSGEKGGLVKAPKNEIMELADHTRVVESDSLPNHRPISLSNIDVVDSMSSSGIRPVMSNSFEISTTDSLPGHRPVAVSRLRISDIDTLPGHRPIASNDIDEDPVTLMGYLD
ncbi:MAG: hypothetical protein WBD47_22305 [Phormidesmis sp.]